MPAAMITCEHGGNRIPAACRRLFAGRERLLHSHRGWDPGAAEIARALGARLKVEPRVATISRLVVDLNRSVDNPSLLSSITAGLPEHAKAALLERHYFPYRRAVEQDVRRLASRGQVAHISVHTFTPILRGRRRDVDIGLLFDPARSFETNLARAWAERLRRDWPRMRIRFNAPYKGTDDGLTTYLRTLFEDDAYAGIELEVNQRFPRRRGRMWGRLPGSLAETLRAAVDAVT